MGSKKITSIGRYDITKGHKKDKDIFWARSKPYSADLKEFKTLKAAKSYAKKKTR